MSLNGAKGELECCPANPLIWGSKTARILTSRNAQFCRAFLLKRILLLFQLLHKKHFPSSVKRFQTALAVWIETRFSSHLLKRSCSVQAVLVSCIVNSFDTGVGFQICCVLLVSWSLQVLLFVSLVLFLFKITFFFCCLLFLFLFFLLFLVVFIPSILLSSSLPFSFLCRVISCLHLVGVPPCWCCGCFGPGVFMFYFGWPLVAVAFGCGSFSDCSYVCSIGCIWILGVPCSFVTMERKMHQ